MTPPMERIFVVVVVVFVSTSGAEDHSGDDKRSNVILILTDDQDWTLGSMKAMPKTDKLFENRGTRFLNGFVTTPICCPSRASILTGQYAHNHNVTSNVEGECYSLAWINGPEKQTIGQRMKDAGYATAFFGKYINGYKGKLVPGWDEWLALQGNSKYYNYTLARYNSQQNFTYLERHADNERDYLPTLMTERALLHMQKVMIQKPRKPLFMILSYPSPHGPEEADYKYQHKYQKETVPRKANFNNGTDGKHWMMRYRPPLSQTNIEFIDLLYQRRLQTLYSVDNAVHELFLRLWLMNALNNSYVFLTSDHGYHLGQFRCLKGKGLPYEDDIRVPFFAYGPRIPKRM
jgi:extracellular sulfatase Sulf